MKEIYFDDLVAGFRPKAKNTGHDQIRIPKGCLSCDGCNWNARECLEMNCPIYDFSTFGLPRERNYSNLRFVN